HASGVRNKRCANHDCICSKDELDSLAIESDGAPDTIRKNAADGILATLRWTPVAPYVCALAPRPMARHRQQCHQATGERQIAVATRHVGKVPANKTSFDYLIHAQ